jgi:hypothetical protein
MPRSLIAIALLGFLAPHVSALVLSACAAAVVVGIATADYSRRRVPGDGEAAGATAGLRPGRGLADG